MVYIDFSRGVHHSKKFCKQAAVVGKLDEAAAAEIQDQEQHSGAERKRLLEVCMSLCYVLVLLKYSILKAKLPQQMWQRWDVLTQELGALRDDLNLMLLSQPRLLWVSPNSSNKYFF